MTQAHKTPGNKVIFKPALFEDAAWAKYYGQYKEATFEVVDGHGINAKDRDHMSIKNLSTGEVIGSDPMWLQTC